MQEDPMLGFNIQIAIDCAPYLILWFFDSRGKATHVYRYVQGPEF